MTAAETALSRFPLSFKHKSNISYVHCLNTAKKVKPTRVLVGLGVFLVVGLLGFFRFFKDLLSYSDT